MKLKKEERETLVGLGMLLLSLFLFAQVFKIRNRGTVADSPKIVPFIITGVMIFISVIYFLVNAFKAFPSFKAIGSSFMEMVNDRENQKIVLSIAIVAVYVLIGIKFLGFYISSAILLFLCALTRVKGMKWWKALIITAGLVIVLYLLFAVLLGLRLR